MVLHRVDSLSIKLDKSGKIDWSLPENAAILNIPKALAEVLRKYPESFKTLPPEFLAREGKNMVKAVHDGVNDKIAAGKIPPNEDGSDKTADEYMNEIADMTDEKLVEVQDYKNNQKQQTQNHQQTQQRFDDMENSW